MTDRVEIDYTITTSEGEPVDLSKPLTRELNVAELIEYHYAGCESREVTDDEIADMVIENVNDWFFAAFAAGVGHESIKEKAIPAVRKALEARDAKVQAA